MRFTCIALSLAILLPLPIPGASQQSPQRDAQAVAILTQALNAAGGITALGAIQDFTASGRITYYWAGQETSGPVALRGRGPDEFRMDAELPEGTRSWAVTREGGTLKQPDGSTSPIANHNAIKLGSLTFYLPKIVAAFNDPGTTISYHGFAKCDGLQLHHIRIQRSPAAVGSTLLNSLTLADFYIDPTTSFVVRIEDTTHPENTFTESFRHVVRFSDFRSVSGIIVPFKISEETLEQRILSIQLDSIKFNSGLTDLDFQIASP